LYLPYTAAQGSNFPAPPDLTSDSSRGFSVGFEWYDYTNNRSYICTDNSYGAAVWIDATPRFSSRPRYVMSKGQITNSQTKGGGDTNAQHLSRVGFGSGPYAVADLQAVYWWGFINGGSGETTLGNGGAVEVAFEGNGHSGRRLTFNGNTSWTAIDKAMFMTDQHPEVVLGPYSQGFFRTLVNVTAGQFWPMTFYNGITTGAQKAVSGLTAGLLSSGAVTGGTQEAGQFGPVAVIGKTAGPSIAVAVLDCSLGDGTNDVKDATGFYQPVGYPTRGLVYDADGVTASAPIPHAKLTKGSETLALLTDPATGSGRCAAMRWATDVFLGPMASNDFANSATLANTKAKTLQVIGLARAYGARVWAAKIPPRCTGTGFTQGATNPAAGQTYYSAAFSPGGDAEQYNNWLDTLVGDRFSGLDGVFDLYSLCVHPQNPWKWRDDMIMSRDGVHFEQNVHIMIGQAFSAWVRKNMRPVW
jgi:hypothetical protein